MTVPAGTFEHLDCVPDEWVEGLSLVPVDDDRPIAVGADRHRDLICFDARWKIDVLEIGSPAGKGPLQGALPHRDCLQGRFHVLSHPRCKAVRRSSPDSISFPAPRRRSATR